MGTTTPAVINKSWNTSSFFIPQFYLRQCPFLNITFFVRKDRFHLHYQNLFRLSTVTLFVIGKGQNFLLNDNFLQFFQIQTESRPGTRREKNLKENSNPFHYNRVLQQYTCLIQTKVQFLQQQQQQKLTRQVFVHDCICLAHPSM